jgi:hypothetical protein
VEGVGGGSSMNNNWNIIPRVESTLTKPWEYGLGGKISYMIGRLPTPPPTSYPTGYYRDDDNDAVCGASYGEEHPNNAGEEMSCKSPKMKKKKNNSNNHHTLNMVDMEDEFDTGRVRPRGVSTSSEFNDEQQESIKTEEANNIDPLFRTDLDDLLQKSALPFPIDHAAKFAIGFHRMWIYILWTIPSTTLHKIVKALRSWMRYPPVILIFTLLIRGANRVLLGDGKSMDGMEGRGDSVGKSDKLDVMKKVMDTVKNYIEGSFPWLVFVLGTLYDVVKVDMYVVFCGLLVGLVMPLHHGWIWGGGIVLGDGEL